MNTKTIEIVETPHGPRLREVCEIGTVRTIMGREWKLEAGTWGQRWRARDCMATVGLNDKANPDMPYSVFGISYPTFEAATRFAVKRHNKTVADAREILRRWPDAIPPSLEREGG